MSNISQDFGYLYNNITSLEGNEPQKFMKIAK
jgi:hypothetical protein